SPLFFSSTTLPPPTSTLFPYTTLFRSDLQARRRRHSALRAAPSQHPDHDRYLGRSDGPRRRRGRRRDQDRWLGQPGDGAASQTRSEEHTSELQSLRHLVCRLLLEKKKK